MFLSFFRLLLLLLLFLFILLNREVWDIHLLVYGVCVLKAYDVCRVQISEANGANNDKMLYNVASKTVNVRIQKAIDNEVAALLDDGDVSRFGSDVEDLEEDFVIQANLPEEGEGVGLDENLNLNKESEGANKLFKESDTFGFQENEVRKHFVEAGDGCCSEKPRVRRILDEQFDLVRIW